MVYSQTRLNHFKPLQTFNMSTPVLLIKYAMASCSIDQVKGSFNYEFGEDIVGFVKELLQVDRNTGKPYKMFFVHFIRSNGNFNAFIEDIKTNSSHNLYYSPKWFWKVIIAETRVFDAPDKPAAKPVAKLFSDPVLLVKYAREACSEDQVKAVFNAEFKDDIVDKVVTLSKIDGKTQAPYKMFFIHFSKTNPALDAFVLLLQEFNLKKVYYDAKWYWNVVLADSCLKPKKEDCKPIIEPVIIEPVICFETPEPSSGIVCDVVISDQEMSEIFAEMKLEKRFIEVAASPEALALEESCKKKAKIEPKKKHA